MDAEVIAIGDELTSGQRLDTNSQWISQRLGDLGVRVLFHSTAADDLQACSQTFRAAIDRADVVVSTGGLGPTADDLTREVIAAATGTELVLDEESLATIRDRFTRRGRTMPPQNEIQAMFPAGSRPIYNPHGSAPGIAMEIARGRRGPCHLFALPGVPAELFEMWEQTVGGAIATAIGSPRLIRHRRIKCFGTGESHLEAMLPDLIRRGRHPSVGITVSHATITLRITAEGASEEECYHAMEPTIATIHECLGDLVFGAEEDELEHALARLLGEQGKSLATVEWGTEGLLARWLGAVPELRDHYSCGLVLPGASGLAGALDVPASLVTKHGAVSRELAVAMAEGARKRLEVDYALAVSDLPHYAPDAAQPERFFVALASPGETTVRRFPYAGHPAILKTLAAKNALNMLRLALLSNDKGESQ